MTSTVIYQSELRTICTHERSGSSFETDAPPDNNGKGDRFSPTDLTATSLATCMLTVMGIKARELGFDLDGLKADVEKIMVAEPRRIGGINLSFHIPPSLRDLDEKKRNLLKQIGENCPVMHSLHPDIAISIDWSDWQ